MNFNEYWKEKELKRRKSWVGKAKRLADQHKNLEQIRVEVYLPIDYTANFVLDDYKELHYVKKNPVIDWQQGRFAFSESGIRQAMETEGADMRLFEMETNKQSIVGKEAPQPAPTDYYSYLPESMRWDYCPPQKAFDFEKEYRAWLRRIYKICTDLQTCKLTYGGVSMIIRRYTTDDMPFAYYELIPCEQLVKSAMLLQEADFYTLNTATLLMEMAAEYELRQEEMNVYAKKLKLRKLDAVVAEDITYELWDDKKLEKKIEEYIKKNYPMVKVLDQLLRPWKLAITKYFQDIKEREIKNYEDKINSDYLLSDFSRYYKEILKPYFDKHDLAEVKMHNTNGHCLEYHGYMVKFSGEWFHGDFYPNAHIDICIQKILNQLPMSALVHYLKRMPEMTEETSQYINKAMHLYDKIMQKNPVYRQKAEFLESLATQHEGTPVGKLLKYLRWNVVRFYKNDHFQVSSIKVHGKTSFCFTEKNVKYYEGDDLIEKDAAREYWLNSDSHYLCSRDISSLDEAELQAFQTDPSTKNLMIAVEIIRFWIYFDNYDNYDEEEPYYRSFLPIDFVEQYL